MKNVPKTSRHKLCPKCTGVSFGIVWAALILITGWVSMTGWGVQFVDLISSLYTGYNSSFVGGIIGGIWGFFFGGILGLAFALVYNKMLSK